MMDASDLSSKSDIARLSFDCLEGEPIDPIVRNGNLPDLSDEGLGTAHYSPYDAEMEFSKVDAAIAEDSQSDSIRLLLLDRHVLFRESLARLLASSQEFESVAECSSPSQGLKIIKDSHIAVVLVDIGLAKEFIESARRARYVGKFLVVAREVDAMGSATVLKYGASGIFLESDSLSCLMQAIRFVAKGDAWVDQKVIQPLAGRYEQRESRWPGNLTEREQTVSKKVIDGLTNRKIAGELGVSETAVKATLQHLFAKLGVRTRSQLVRIALQETHSIY